MKYQKRSYFPKITLNGSLHSITIAKDVIRLLGVPSHVCIMKSLDGFSLAVRPCEPTEYLSLKVPELDKWTRNTHFRVYSLEFVQEFLLHNGFSECETITMFGKLDSEKNIVIFQKNPEAC